MKDKQCSKASITEWQRVLNSAQVMRWTSNWGWGWLSTTYSCSNLFKFGVLSSRPSQTIPFSTLSSLAVFWGVDNGNLYMTTRTTNSKPTLLVELGSNEIFDTRNYTIHSPSGRTIHPFCLACQRGHWRAGGMRCVAKPAISAFGCIGESSDQLQSV